jgi:hypothetical protein
MKKLFLVFAFAAASSFAAELTGFVGDASCGAKHADASDASAACAKKCVGKGSAAVLVTKDAKVYKIDAASQEKAKEFVGKTVTINGSIKDDTVTISSIQ